MEREEEVNLVRRFKESLFPDGSSNGAKREKRDAKIPRGKNTHCSKAHLENGKEARRMKGRIWKQGSSGQVK